MDEWPTGESRPSPGRCADERAAVQGSCADARSARVAHEHASETARQMRRRLTAARSALEAAQEQSDPRLGAERKVELAKAYRDALAVAVTPEERQQAAATWARDVDRLNRQARGARATLSLARSQLAALERAAAEAEAAAEAARVRSASSDAECLQARMRLAACEEQSAVLVARERPAAAVTAQARPGTGRPAPAASQAGSAAASKRPFMPPAQAAAGPPLADERAAIHAAMTASDEEPTPIGAAAGPMALEAILDGDRAALRHVAAAFGELTGRLPSEAQLLIGELIDAVLAAAAEAGALAFDEAHPFWSRLSMPEARDVMRALADLGFRVDPHDGWHGGRAPIPSDLSLALAYAGMDARGMRSVPSAAELRSLPESIQVAPLEFLSSGAPDLALDRVVRLLGSRADALEGLWDEWGQLRPLLLGPVPPTLSPAPRS